MVRGETCPNLNHRHGNAQVRFCPDCGQVVNESIPNRRCDNEKHDARRRSGNQYCVHCGERLIRDIPLGGTRGH